MLKVIFFARLREIIGVDEIDLELKDNQVETVQDMLKILAEKFSEFDDYIDRGNRLMIAVNQEICDADQELNSGDELALFPPVTGG